MLLELAASVVCPRISVNPSIQMNYIFFVPVKIYTRIHAEPVVQDFIWAWKSGLLAVSVTGVFIFNCTVGPSARNACYVNSLMPMVSQNCVLNIWLPTLIWYSIFTKCHLTSYQDTVKPVFTTTWEIRTTWELRTTTLVPRPIHHIDMDLRNKTTSEFRTVLDSPLRVPNSQVSL